MQKLDDSFGFLINYTSNNIRRYATDYLKRNNLDLTVDQWGVLALLEQEGGKLTHADLATQMQKDPPTLTRIVDLLCKKELTRRVPDHKDRRVIQVMLTSAGKKRVEKALPIAQEIRRKLWKGLSNKDYMALKKILERVNKNVK